MIECIHLDKRPCYHIITQSYYSILFARPQYVIVINCAVVPNIDSFGIAKQNRWPYSNVFASVDKAKASYTIDYVIVQR